MNLITATQSARKTTGRNIGTKVKQGKFQVVEIDQTRKPVVETALSGWLSLNDAVSFLGEIK